LALTKKQITNDYANLYLRVPKRNISNVKRTIENVLLLANINFSLKTEPEDEESTITLEDLFPDLHSGSAIKGLRYREGLTQEKLAKKINVTRKHISEIENGKREIDKDLAKRLSTALNTDYKVFMASFIFAEK